MFLTYLENTFLEEIPRPAIIKVQAGNPIAEVRNA